MNSVRSGPLAGVRVLDLTQVWAGPLCVQLLADYGAEVIKVESRERAVEEYSRKLRISAGRHTGQRPPEVLAVDSMMRNRIPLTLDLTRPEGRSVLARLAVHVDVIVENYSARVTRKWKLDYPTLSEVNDRLIVVSLSAAGHHGPWSEILTFGPSLTSLYGTKSLMRYPDDDSPMEDMSESDPVGGMYGFLATAAALAERDATGRGRHVDFAQGEAPLLHAMEGILNTQLGLPIPRGNRHSTMAPQGIYRCLGEDDWIALTIEHDTDWAVLCQAIEMPALEAQYPFLADRQRHHDEIDAAITSWTSTRTAEDADRILVEAGLASLPVLTNKQQFEDEHLRFRRGLGMEDAVLPPGMHGGDVTNAFPIKMSGTPATIWSGEVLFIEPAVEPLRSILSMPEDEIAALVASGVA